MRVFLRKWWKVGCLALLLVFAGCSWGMLEYTHNPGFCQTCHVMDPYYAAWKTSSHNMVGCVDCHYQPGLRYELRGKLDALNQVVAYWTGSYNTKFYAEIDDASCMRQGCHNSRLIEGPIEFKRGIKFDHAGHYGQEMRGIKLRCTSCHSQIVQGNHMAVTEFTCFLCHFRGYIDVALPQQQDFCLQCHDFPDYLLTIGNLNFNHADFVDRGVICQRCHIDVVEGDGMVEDRACLQCHSDPEQISRIGKVSEVHLNHVTNHKVECFNCHANIDHRVPHTRGTVEVSCSECHSSTHLGPRSLYAGTGGRGVDDMPSAMFLAQVDCIGCHLDQSTYGEEFVMKGSTLRPTVQGCIDCHGDMGQDIFNFWQASLENQIALTDAILDRARQLIKNKPPASVPYVAIQRLEDAEFNRNFVKFGKGIHNLNYALALLSQAGGDAQECIDLINAASAGP